MLFFALEIKMVGNQKPTGKVSLLNRSGMSAGLFADADFICQLFDIGIRSIQTVVAYRRRRWRGGSDI